ncbi:putative dehydrogenase [Catenibacillus scindens]|uniref:Putative dehydrogenase n=1 Tax=Catenibacillus scindens TaxID=673271 RepID=A0A7W8M612_9FIRM|nr:Gfo/Idh/MocA family oxidoreductase [Catenibacillus scindens]MBB5265600.1 putative dehydrogenase [Catenibacillus scindens]MBB5266037.1 putative dehydrogenase [Catenibacillus scindens]
MRKTLRYGMVGGDLNAFIGGVHRIAVNFDGRAQLVAGCFNPDMAANKECGQFYRLDEDRIYADYKEMAQKESEREDGIDFVSIVTPNFLHYQVAKEFLNHGINVLCEKPLSFEVGEAEELKALAEEKGLYFAVNYSYSGNNMVKEARELVKQGVIGDVINVNAEYLQEYLVDDIGKGDQKMVKLSSWRKDPKVAGISNCVGDIGTHIEHTVSYITGLKLKKVAAVLDNYGQPLDLNANILVEFDNGAHGVYSSSQVCVGHMNGLVVRIFGTEGAIEWVQENPNVLSVTLKGQPTQIYNRGMGYVSERSKEMNRLPSGHPEGLYEAFANIYKCYISTILKKVNGEEPAEGDLDFPTVDDGIAGVKFIHACVESSKNNAVWVEI